MGNGKQMGNLGSGQNVLISVYLVCIIMKLCGCGHSAVISVFKYGIICVLRVNIEDRGRVSIHPEPGLCFT